MLRFKNKNGLTLTEVMISVILMMVVFLAVSALFVASHRFHLSESDKVILGYELKYAMEHIYKNTMQGIGNKDNPAIVITPGMNERQVVIRQIDDNDPATPPTYSNFSDDIQITYSITDSGTLSYTKSTLPSGPVLELDENMIPSVILLYSDGLSRFYLDGKILRIKLTAQFPLMRAGVRQEQKTLYGACSSRLATYN